MSGSVPGTSGASLPKRPHLESGNEAHQSGKKSASGSVSTSSAELRRKGGMGLSTPDVPEPSTSSSSSSSTSATFQVGMLFKYFDQWRSITSNRFVHNMVQDHHLQLRSHPPLFCDFNVKVAAVHHPVIQKEVDELLAKGATEPFSGGAGFYSSMFVVPKCTGGLRPILNLKHFNHYMHIPSFKMPTLKHVQQLIQHGDCAFSTDLQDAYLHVPIVKHHHHFLHFVWHNEPYQWKGLPFGLATALGFLRPSPNLLCSFAIVKVCILLSVWMTSWCSFTLSRWVSWLTCFCVPCWSILVYILSCQSLTIASLRPLLSWGYVGILSACQYLCLLIS